MARGVAEELGEAVLKDGGALSEAEWLARIDKVGQREGFFRYLGADHADRKSTRLNSSHG